MDEVFWTIGVVVTIAAVFGLIGAVAAVLFGGSLDTDYL